MNTATLIILAIIIVCAFFALRKRITDIKSGKSCCGGCDGCSEKCSRRK